MATSILYIEDSFANRLLMKKVIRATSQYKLVEVENAEDGLDLLSSLNPSVILMDISLPGMDGFKALKEIKSRFSKDCEIPVIAVSADAMPDHIEKGLSAGFFDYIVKPVDFNKLMNAIERAIIAS